MASSMMPSLGLLLLRRCQSWRRAQWVRPHGLELRGVRVPRASGAFEDYYVGMLSCASTSCVFRLVLPL